MFLMKAEANITSLFEGFKRTVSPFSWGEGGIFLHLNLQSTFQIAVEIQPLVFSRPSVDGEMSNEENQQYFRDAHADMNGEIGITQECGCAGFNGPDGRQGCVLTWTVESNQGGRLIVMNPWRILFQVVRSALKAGLQEFIRKELSVRFSTLRHF
ncbi:hypothetical protein TNCV_2016491 [Trichonephila clavipes]|nr:hypothetical protein TNCV_2016491 [Trichonephila clavipes]